MDRTAQGVDEEVDEPKPSTSLVPLADTADVHHLMPVLEVPLTTTVDSCRSCSASDTTASSTTSSCEESDEGEEAAAGKRNRAISEQVEREKERERERERERRREKGRERG